MIIYIKIPEKHDGTGFLTLAKSGGAVICLPENTYGVQREHLTLLRKKRVPFKKLENSKVHVPKLSRPHYEKV